MRGKSCLHTRQNNSLIKTSLFNDAVDNNRFVFLSLINIIFPYQICGELEGMVWLFAQLETDAVSVERLKEYTELEQEADWTSDNAPPRYCNIYPHCPDVFSIKFYNLLKLFKQYQNYRHFNRSIDISISL